MEQIFEFTKSELILAFQTYNIECLENPDDFGVLAADVDSAKSQAEKLLSILEDIKSKK